MPAWLKTVPPSTLNSNRPKRRPKPDHDRCTVRSRPSQSLLTVAAFDAAPCSGAHGVQAQRFSYPPGSCTLTDPSWELDDEELTVHSDEDALELGMSVKHPRKRPADFTESRIRNVCTLCRDPPVCALCDIAQVKMVRKIEATANENVTAPNTIRNGQGIEIGRGGGVHGDLRDQMSDMEWSPLEDHMVTMDTPLQDHFSEAAEPTKVNNETYLIETAFPIIQSSTPIRAAADAAADVGADNVSTETKQRILSQPAPSAWLGDTPMETILPLWLLLKSRYLKLHVPQSWASFYLSSDWPTDVGNIHDVVVDLFRPARNHWILLRIEVDRACVSAFDPLRPTDPGLEEAAKAIVAAMGVDWQQGKWRFVAEERPQQQNTDDCGEFVLLSAMHATANLPLPPATILHGNLWRLLFTLLIRKSTLTPYEASSICFVDTSDPVTSEDTGHCQQLVRQLRTLKPTQRSLEAPKICLSTSLTTSRL
ncbi:hypothetical protein KCV03_g8465, partial [Aureobasidium melanogenum]